MLQSKTILPSDSSDQLQLHLVRLRENVESVFFGRPGTVTQLLVGLIGCGHILIEDVPGVGKTVLARALARSIKGIFARIQLTPDLLPSDILGVSIYNDKTGLFEFKRGPIFANIVLADEINRTTPRTQSALLEAMNEYQISVDGKTFPLDRPFMVIATQNPFEFEGTYFLPESQLDRFILRLRIGYASREDERRILLEQPGSRRLEELGSVMTAADVLVLQQAAERIRIDDVLVDYIQDIVEATRHHPAVEIGVSPRGALALTRAVRAMALLSDRQFVIPDDVKELARPVCAHRLVSKSYLHEGRTVAGDQIMDEILAEVHAPS
ncbi:MAG: MoxR family ATPase [Phycisphaerae bacterium]